MYYFQFTQNPMPGRSYEQDISKLNRKNRTPVKRYVFYFLNFFKIIDFYVFFRPSILVFDSLNGASARARIVATLREWITEEYRTKYSGCSERDFSIQSMKGALVKVPHQPNFTDCGLFVMHFFQKFFEVSLIYLIAVYKLNRPKFNIILLFLVPYNGLYLSNSTFGILVSS